MECMLLLTTLALLLLTGCGAQGAVTPETLAREQIAIRYPGAQQVQVIGLRDAPGGVVVLYRLTDAGAGGDPLLVFGQITAQRGVRGWQLLSHASGGVPQSQGFGDQRIEYGVSSSGGLVSLSNVYGRRLRPEVAAVEALLTSGAPVRDDLPDGAFAFTVRGNAEQFCALRLLDADGAELERLELPGVTAGRCGSP